MHEVCVRLENENVKLQVCEECAYHDEFWRLSMTLWPWLDLRSLQEDLLMAHDLMQKAEQKEVKREQVRCSRVLEHARCFPRRHQSGLPLDGLARWLEIRAIAVRLAIYIGMQWHAMLQHLTQQRKHNEELLDLLEQQQRTLLQNSTDLADYEKTLVQMAAELDRYRQMGAATPGKVCACGSVTRKAACGLTHGTVSGGTKRHCIAYQTSAREPG